jgi:hypothetical protein
MSSVGWFNCYNSGTHLALRNHRYINSVNQLSSELQTFPYINMWSSALRCRAVSCLVISTLQMEAASPSETLITTYLVRWYSQIYPISLFWKWIPPVGTVSASGKPVIPREMFQELVTWDPPSFSKHRHDSRPTQQIPAWIRRNVFTSTNLFTGFWLAVVFKFVTGRTTAAWE